MIVTACTKRAIAAWFVLSSAMLATVARAAPPSLMGPDGSQFRLTLSDRMRGEFADWFDAGPPLDNTEYGFFANRLQVGAAGEWRRLRGYLQYQHTMLAAVPHDSIGVGGNYRAHTDRTFQEQGWLRQGWLQGDWNRGDVRATVQGGRLRYLDGVEISSKDPTLDWLRKTRIAERLIGPFDFTHVGRSFDGVRVAAENDLINVSGFYVVPTSGGFEIRGGEHMGIDLGGLSLAWKDSERFPGLQSRLFWIHYHDRRTSDGDVVAVDNRPAALRALDQRRIRVETFGAEILRVQHVGPGVWDALLWTVGQTGQWQSLSHRSWAYAVETGYRWTAAPAQPWLRLAFFRSSGDDDPGDRRHGTFFQLLPTARLYAFTPFYNLMNSQDLMVQLITRPLGSLTARLDLHWLRATEGSDLIYAGGGATRRDVFGFTGPPARGARDVAYISGLTVSYPVLPNLELQGYVSHAVGQSAIRRAFSHDARLTYGFIEATLSL